MTGRLAGRAAVITGAASGIGRASAERFAAEGARVVLWDRNPTGIADAVSAIRSAGGRADGIEVDIADAGSVADAATRTLSLIDQCTVLMNNAGVLDDYATVLDTDEALWDRTIGINLKGMFLVTKALLPSMLEAGGGAIVNTASVSAFIAGGGGIAYTSSKHGVIGFTRQMAFDYAKSGVRVNAIAPGAVETGMTKDILTNEDLDVVQALRNAPAGRHAQPAEIANVALFLVGDEATFIHGAVYSVDGGWTII